MEKNKNDYEQCYRYQTSVYALKTFRTINYIIIAENEFGAIDTE